MISTEHDIAEQVKQSLKTRPLGGEFSVVETAVRHEDDWWYVPIMPCREVVRDDAYYDMLADVEDEMRERQGLNVTLVPTANIIKLQPRRASLRPMHIMLHDWQVLCNAAGVTLKAVYDRSECQRLAEAIRINPQIIHFDPPSWSEEAINFFQNCEGLETT